MKKRLLIGLLALAAGYHYAQAQPYFAPNATPVSQTIFGATEPGKQQCNFFVWLPEKNRIWFDLTWVNHLDSLKNVDSLLQETVKLLGPLLDSFKVDSRLRRVDVDLTQKPALFRVTTHLEKGETYTRVENELVQVKMDQDTVRIKFLANQGGGSYLNLLLNNAADLQHLPADVGGRSLQLVRNGLAKHYAAAKGNTRHRYYAVYNLESGQLIAPDKDNYHAIRSRNDYLAITLVKPSVAYVRGSLLTSVSLGVAFNYSKTLNPSWGSTHSFGLFWDPQFSFRRNAAGVFQSFRNDFLTIRFEETPNGRLSNFQLLSTLSVSYLIGRSGDLFERNTYRLGVLAAASGRLRMEPELYFNDFFKNVSPAIRVSLKIL